MYQRKTIAMTVAVEPILKGKLECNANVLSEGLRRNQRNEAHIMYATRLIIRKCIVPQNVSCNQRVRNDDEAFRTEGEQVHSTMLKSR